MDTAVENYWEIRLQKCREALEKNNFNAFAAQTPEDARKLVLEQILPKIRPASFSWGDSMTFESTGLMDDLKQMPDLQVIETFDKKLSREVLLERRRQALLTDLFITGSNAVTADGQLVNLDMIGNRVAGITFGPKHVIIFAGRNKIVPDLEAAMNRVQNYAAPVNAIRHDIATPCVKTGTCMNCKSPQRICNTWTITRKSWPEGRINVVLINADMGI